MTKGALVWREWRRPLAWTLCVGVPPVAFSWGFSVDDALISARVAHQWATGAGYVFNPRGPVVDAVTPLGWVFLLAPFAEGSVLDGFAAARWLGTIAWLAAVLVTARQLLANVRAPARYWAMAVLGLSTAPAAWASSGMETGFVALLGACAVTRSRWATLAAGVAAGWRPELIPWAMVLGVGSFWTTEVVSRRSWRSLIGVGAALLPVLVVGCCRWLGFGSAAPLAVLVKPPDFRFGVYYVAATLIWAGPLWLLVACKPWRGLPPRYQVIGLSIAAHTAALSLAGGDWMPLFRLWIPVWPSILLLGAVLLERSGKLAQILRISLAVMFSVVVTATTVLPGRSVVATRRSWIAQLRPMMKPGDIVGTLDIGWVGASTDGEVVDFAGLTDPMVARLSGPHHAKHLENGFLDRRRVNVLVLLVDSVSLWQQSPALVYSRTVERRLFRQRGIGDFSKVGEVGSAASGQTYVIMRRPPL